MNAQLKAHSHEGDLVEFDIRRLRRQAMPEYINGGGGGVSAKTIEAMLDRMIEITGFAGRTDADNDLQTSLKLFRGLIRRQKMHIEGMKSSLDMFERCMADSDDEAAKEELEVMKRCATPVEKVIVY